MYKVIILLFLVASFSACENFFEQVVEVDIPEHASTLAPTFNFSESDSIHIVYVGKTLGILDPTQNQDFTDASVSLLKDGAVFMNFEHDANGYYSAAGVVTLGTQETYTLKVNAPGFEEITAVQIPPAEAEVVKISYEEEGTVDLDGERVDLITIEIDDLGGVENFYSVDIVVYTVNGDYGVTSPDTNDPIGEYLSSSLVFADETFEGKNYELAVYFYDWIVPGEIEKIVVRLNSWS